MKYLIVVDMQKDFIYGALGSKEAQKIVKAVVKKIKWYMDNGYRIIFTRDTHTQDYMNTLEGQKLPVIHCVEGTDGWEIIDEIKAEVDMNNDNVICINKSTFGYLSWTNLPDDWRNLLEFAEEVEIIGVCTDICVVSNALIVRASYPNMKITVDSNCCAGVTVESHEAALMTMKSCQIDVI